MRANLDDYRRHAELYGPELLLDTAGRDLSETALGELRSYVCHLERTKRWKAGRWHERKYVARACEECGQDLPPNAGPRMRFHSHCRERLKRRRQRADAQSPLLAA
jgi:hypothetical protein